MSKILKKIKKGIKNPKLIQAYLEMKFKKKIFSPLLYHLTDGKYSIPPYRIGIEVNSTCNLRCKMCDIGQQRSNMQFYKNLKVGGELPLNILINLIDDVKKFHPRIVINTIEPLLYKNLIELISYIVQNKLVCSVTTNGLLLENFAYELVETRLPELWISIDGPPEIHNGIRGVPNSFEKAYKGIKMIIERKKQLKVSMPTIGIAYTISNYNYKYLEETASIFKKLGVNRMVYTHLNFIDDYMVKMHNKHYAQFFGKVRPSTISAVDPKKVDVDVLTDQIILLKKKYAGFINFLPDIETKEEVKIYYHDSSKFVKNNKCKIAWKNAQILSNGDVIPASRCFHIVMGNIYEKPFTKIWNDAPFRNFRKNIKKIGTTPACSRCCGLFG